MHGAGYNVIIHKKIPVPSNNNGASISHQHAFVAALSGGGKFIEISTPQPL